jgi:hypothetical protein
VPPAGLASCRRLRHEISSDIASPSSRRGSYDLQKSSHSESRRSAPALILYRPDTYFATLAEPNLRRKLGELAVRRDLAPLLTRMSSFSALCERQQTAGAGLLYELAAKYRTEHLQTNPPRLQPCGVAIVDSELAQNCCDVMVHGSSGDEQSIRDLPILESFTDQREDFDFAGGQAGSIGSRSGAAAAPNSDPRRGQPPADLSRGWLRA